jgi:regulator of sigma E protease
MASVISLGIGLFNFFPIPPLDGGGMLIAIIEGARRGRRLSDRSVRLAQSVGTALLLAMIIMITFSDIIRLISGTGFGL